MHRGLAWGKLSEEEREKVPKIGLVPWKDKILDKEENLEDLRIAAAKFNLKHGKRLKDSDIEFQAKKIVESKAVEELGNINSELAEIFQLSENRMSEIIGPLVRSRKASRNSVIYKLSRLGWTQQEIAEQVDISQGRIAQIIRKFDVEEINNAFDKGVNL